MLNIELIKTESILVNRDDFKMYGAIVMNSMHQLLMPMIKFEDDLENILQMQMHELLDKFEGHIKNSIETDKKICLNGRVVMLKDTDALRIKLIDILNNDIVSDTFISKNNSEGEIDISDVEVKKFTDMILEGSINDIRLAAFKEAILNKDPMIFHIAKKYLKNKKKEIEILRKYGIK